jgi:hypothetical protein
MKLSGWLERQAAKCRYIVAVAAESN